MELTVEKAVIIKEALKEFDKKEVPAKLSYWLGRLEDKIDPMYNRYNKENRKLILEKYGEKLEGSDRFQVPKEKMEEYQKDVDEILNQKETIDISLKFDLFEGVNVSKDFFRALGEIVEID